MRLHRHDAAQRADTQAEPASAGEAACAFLRQTLAAGPRPVADVERDARAMGLTQRTLERARKRLGVRAVRANFTGGWLLQLPVEEAPPSRGAGGTGGDTPTDVPKAANSAQGGQHSDMAAFEEDGHPGTRQTPPDAPKGEGAGVAAPAGSAPAPEGMWERVAAWVRCPATGTTHEYAKLRDAQGHRLCIHCMQVEPKKAEENGGAA